MPETRESSYVRLASQLMRGILTRREYAERMIEESLKWNDHDLAMQLIDALASGEVPAI